MVIIITVIIVIIIIIIIIIYQLENSAPRMGIEPATPRLDAEWSNH